VLSLALAGVASAAPKLADPKLARSIERVLKQQNLPSRGLAAALEHGKDPAAAVTRALATPNLAGSTWAPVKAPAGNAALVERYVRAGLLLRAEDGRLYARLRDPSSSGTDPQHNRCLGADSCMAKGTGTVEPISVTLPGGGQAKVALYQDPEATRSYHVFKGVLTAEQAQGFVGEDYQKLYRSLKKELASPALRDLVRKHHLTRDVIPNSFLTLELEALPVATASPGGLRSLGSGLAPVAASVKRGSPGLVWLKPDAYWQLARKGEAEAKNPGAVVQLYTASHAAIRSGTMASGGKAMGQLADSMPALDWSARYSVAQAAVHVGWWAPFFADYGWGLRREKRGELRVYELASGRPLVVGGDARQGSLQAARVLCEGNAMVSGLVLRSLWRAELTPIGSLGGTPFQARNSNPRTRLDLDTIGPSAAPRPLDIYTTKTISLRESRKRDLTWSSDPFYWKSGLAKTGSPLSGIIDMARALGLDQPDWQHGQALLKRVAFGARLDSLKQRVAVPTVADSAPAK